MNDCVFATWEFSTEFCTSETSRSVQKQCCCKCSLSCSVCSDVVTKENGSRHTGLRY